MRLIAVKVLDHRGNGFASDVLAGLRWIRENRERYGNTHRKYIRGFPVQTEHDREFGSGAGSQRSLGRRPGGRGGCGQSWTRPNDITTPGISRKVITVGCSDDHKEVDVMGSRMVDYSGRGPTMACICKPDIVAPGSGIVSCSNEPGKYFSKSGTSMSTPLVSGAICLAAGKISLHDKQGCKAAPAGAGGGYGASPQPSGLGEAGCGKTGGRPVKGPAAFAVQCLCLPAPGGAAGEDETGGGDGGDRLRRQRAFRPAGGEVPRQKIA